MIGCAIFVWKTVCRLCKQKAAVAVQYVQGLAWDSCGCIVANEYQWQTCFERGTKSKRHARRVESAAHRTLRLQKSPSRASSPNPCSRLPRRTRVLLAGLAVQSAMQQVRTVQQATLKTKKRTPSDFLHVRVNSPRENHKDGHTVCCFAQSGRWAEWRRRDCVQELIFQADPTQLDKHNVFRCHIRSTAQTTSVSTAKVHRR